MPFLFTKKTNKQEVVLILDVGSSSVSGSFVEFSSGKAPLVLSVKSAPIKFIQELSGDRFKKEMFKSLGLVLKELNNDSSHLIDQGRKVRKVYCSLASPWFVSQTKTIKIDKDKDFLITENFVSEILNREEESFEGSDLSKYGSERRVDSETIEKKLIDVKLNGYRTLNPVGKKASHIEFNLFMSMSQASILDDIEDTVLKYFHTEELHFNSFTLVSFSVVRDVYERVSNFILLDITGEVTDISLIKAGNILKTTSFPLGKNSLIRVISEELKTSPEEALSSLRLLLGAKLNPSKSKTLNKILDKAKAEWSKSFQKALLEVSQNSSVPTTVFFTSDEDISSLYAEVIKSEDFAQYFMTESLFIVSFVNAFALDSYVSFSNKEEKDTFIAVDSAFFNRIFELRE